MDARRAAERIAAGATLQHLSSPKSAQGANHVYRIWREDGTVIFKVYGADSRDRREAHSLEALKNVPGVPRVLARGVDEGAHWAMFVDGGKWSLDTLPENPGLAETAGETLAAIHESETTAFSNLARGIDETWIASDLQSTVRRLERYRRRVGISAEAIEAAHDVPGPEASEPKVSHTNPIARKFVVDDRGEVTLVNWEWATLAPPEWDLSRAVWSMDVHEGPIAAEGVMRGYGLTIEPVQLDRWIVYHAAQELLHLADQQTSSKASDLPGNLVPEFNRAVLGAAGA
jgi:aminoglycoside phosphotransferase (APT) family kinase protein